MKQRLQDHLIELKFYSSSSQEQYCLDMQALFDAARATSPASVNRFFLYCHLFYKRQFPELCQIFENMFQECKDHSASQLKSINESTIEYFSHKWTSHYFQNLLEAERIRILKPNQFSGENPAVFVGASSLLETQWKWIKDCRDSIYLISSDTALRPMLQYGIMPDAVVSVDSGRGTNFHLMEDLPPELNILTWLGGSRIQFRKKSKLYLFLTNHPLDQWIAQINRIPDSWILNNPSRNIAGMCISLARYLGFQSIYLAGFELKSQSDKTHVRGTGYESYALPLIHRKKSLSSFYPRRVYGRNFSSKNSESMNAVLSTKGIDVKVLDNRTNQLSEFNPSKPSNRQTNELNQQETDSIKNTYDNKNFPILYKKQLEFLEFSLPASLYLNSIASQEISGISKHVVRRFQSQFLEAQE